MQTQVAAYMNNKRKPHEEKTRTPLEPKSIKVPIPTFPPTAMVYSVPKSPKQADRVLAEDETEQPQVDIVSAAIMAKGKGTFLGFYVFPNYLFAVLEERQKERALAKHCDTCTCAKNLKIVYEVSHHHIGTQTGGDYKENCCLKCNEVMTQPLSGGIQILKTVDEKVKRSTPYPNLVVPLPLETTPNLQNIVKVQPNNFLIEKTLSQSNPSENDETQRVDVHESPSKLESSFVTIDTRIPSETKDLIDFNDVTITAVNETPSVHHHHHHKLCDQKSPSFTLEQQQEKRDLEKRYFLLVEIIIVHLMLMFFNSEVAKPSEMSPKDQDHLKGPRYASMRLQTGSKNILLDNAHNNVAPVLYTRSHQHSKSRPPNSSQV